MKNLNTILMLVLVVELGWLSVRNHIPEKNTFEVGVVDGINSEIDQWSKELEIEPPHVQFGEIKTVKGYDDKGQYRKFDSAATYNQDTDTITFRENPIREETVKHEYIHYLQDVSGISEDHEVCFQEAQAYTLMNLPIETIMDWYKLNLKK